MLGTSEKILQCLNFRRLEPLYLVELNKLYLIFIVFYGIITFMKLFWFLSFVLLFVNPVYALQPGFKYLSKDAPEYKNYQAAIERSAKYMREAVSRLAEEKGQDHPEVAQLRSRGESVILKLRSAKFAISSDKNSTFLCNKKNMSFFVDYEYDEDVMYVCDAPRDSLRAKNPSDEIMDITAQLFFHEGIHLTGDKSECNATIFELDIMKNTGVYIQSMANRDRYNSICDFNAYKNINSKSVPRKKSGNSRSNSGGLGSKGAR